MNSFKISLVSILLIGSSSLTACKEPDWQDVKLPDSPDGSLKAKLQTLSEGGGLHVAKKEADWSEYRWLSYGMCKDASVYWSDDRTIIFAYDRAEIGYFVDAPDHWGGATVLLCNRNISQCPEPKTDPVEIESCSFYSM